MRKYPILYKQGISELEDITLEDVPERWKCHYVALKTFWDRWMRFCEQNSRYSHFKEPRCNPQQEKTYETYKNTNKFRFLADWAKDWRNFK